jgi:hypothetical protein
MIIIINILTTTLVSVRLVNSIACLAFTEPVVCFVAVGPLDALFGTLWVGSRKWKQLQEKQQN